MNSHQARKLNTARRDSLLMAKFNQLYNQRRSRIDDVIQILSVEFALSETTILRKVKKNFQEQ